MSSCSGRFPNRRVWTALLVAAVWLLQVGPASSGTTGSLRGRVVDASTKKGIADVRVTVAAPTQVESTMTDSDGKFVFVSLGPDTYTVSAQYSGYEPAADPGVTIIADQVQNVTVALEKSLKVISSVRARGSENLVRSEIGTDVYSVGPAVQKASFALSGPGGLNQAYSALAGVPGVYVPQGQQGWGQEIHIRGGVTTDMAVELDGVPVVRWLDQSPSSTLSTLGQQELQVYPGGAPASADALGMAGYVNQVIRTGTYPGFINAELGVGGPTFYHKAQFEFGGASPNRNLTYYIGFSGVNQAFRYGDQSNNSSNPDSFFAPISISTGLNGQVYDGSGPAYFVPGQSYGQAFNTDRETVANVHFALPHKRDSLKDDLQFLFDASQLHSDFYSSVNDLGGAAYLQNALGYLPTYGDNYVYNGPMMTALTGTEQVTQAPFPNKPAGASFQQAIPYGVRDGINSGQALVKVQYQRNFNERSFFRIFGYSDYSNLLLNGPVSANFQYGGELANLVFADNTAGVNARYQIYLADNKNMVTATASYQRQHVIDSLNFANSGSVVTNYIDAKGNCYNPQGYYASCFTSISDGGGKNTATIFGSPPTLIPCTLQANGLCTTTGPNTPGALNQAHWVVTENGVYEANSGVDPFFTSASLSDEFRPNGKLMIDAGVRFDRIVYRLNNLFDGFPARAFWLNAFNRENCYAPGQSSVSSLGEPNPLTGQYAPCAAGSASPNLSYASPNSVSYALLQPRISATYTLSPDTVLRASYGRYFQPADATTQQSNRTKQDLSGSVSEYLPFGFNTAYHAVRPAVSNSFDASLEHRIKGTDLDFKISPFYRAEQNEALATPISPQGADVSINAAHSRAYGVEFQLNKGDFARDGLAFQLSYTYTHTGVYYDNFANNRNFIDSVNATVQQYNSYTKACASGNAALCGSNGSTNAQPTFAYTDPKTGATTQIPNPYYNSAPQPLFDRNAEYPYGVLPTAFAGVAPFNVPNVASLVVNYRHKKFTITPSLTYASGATYGGPFMWPGYDPKSCAGVLASGAANPQTCSSFLFIPDVYSGRFDMQNSFVQPTRFTANLQLGYQLTPQVHVSLAMVGLVDRCYQHGYAWDASSTCIYAQLPSNNLSPVGNFVPLSQAPPQLRYPYSSYYNNTVIGAMGQRVPFNAVLTLDLHL